MVALRLSNDMECESGERTLASSKTLLLILVVRGSQCLQ